ncbi:hypothetical protein AgCh_017359 [Apium graveolens]
MDVLEDIGRVQREHLLNKSSFSFVVYLNSHLNVGMSFIPGVSLSRYHATGLTLHILEAQRNPDYYEAVEFIRSEAKSLSLETQSIEFVEGKPLVLLKWPVKDPALPFIVLNSHTDVVPADHNKWCHPPFDAIVDGDKIYGRGSQDTKCVGLQYLEAIRMLRSSGFQPIRDVYLSYVPD